MALAQAPLVVFVDVDETLIRNYGTKRIPSVIRHVRALHRMGAELYCWSSGGAAYARATADECGIGDCFQTFLPKPQVMLDDQDPSEWRRPQCVHPTGCEGSTIETYRAALDRF